MTNRMNCKELTDMTNEELWRLFPIILCEHNPEWKNKYRQEESLLRQIINSDILRINHIGSTSIEGLVAKPTIDILMEIEKETNLQLLIHKIESVGYIYSQQPNNPAPHMMFMKGYTPEGFRGQTFHLHIRYYGDWNELYFCKYLQAHPDIAKEYGELKLKLKTKYEHNRDAYTHAKTEFILKITELAKTKFLFL